MNRESLLVMVFAAVLAISGIESYAGESEKGPTSRKTTTGRTYVVNNRAAGAADDNPGTQALPLKTIQAAADRAQPGDTVLVKAGIYREEVVPPRGGTSPDRPITYRAAPGEEVSIRGSQRITTWLDQGDGVWMVELDTAFFKGYNPFARPVAGAWLHRGRDRRLGDVYCNGEAYLQKIAVGDMKSTPKTWYTELKYGYKNNFDFPAERRYPDGKLQIWANFGDVDPNTALTEINARATAFFPEKAGLKYIVVDGFDIRHTAPQWVDIYTTEYGAIGPRYGYGWTIQNCTITNSRNVGICLGVTDEVHFPRGNEGGLLEGGSNIPPLDTIGHHLIRNNVIIGGQGFGRKGLVRRNADVSDTEADRNIYLGGALPFPNKDKQSVVIAARADVELEVGERAATLKLDLPPAALEGTHPLITSKMIGKVPLADMPMEHPDGKPLDITTDYFGKPIVRTRVLPGPFQDLRKGKNSLTLWPKQMPSRNRP